MGAAMVLGNESFNQTFDNLGAVLQKYYPVWTESAFVNDHLSWPSEFPDLHRRLLSLTEYDLLELEDEPKLIRFLSTYLPELDFLADLRFERKPEVKWQAPEKAFFGVPGRKRFQTEGFINAISSLGEISEGKWVDWCSGKGLLARQLYYFGGRSVHCLEIDPELCKSGAEAHRKIDTDMALGVMFHHRDVLAELDTGLLKHSSLHTALHACGDLHLSMLGQAVAAEVPQLACAPCCYHLIEAEIYQPLSKKGRSSGLRPPRKSLRLATAEVCTANALERELRHRELLWRTAFDLGLRESNGLNCYTPTPSVRKSLLKTTFQDFSEATLDRLNGRGASLRFLQTSAVAERDLLDRAANKLARTRRLEKAQLGFRKALEYWLLLDRVLFLQDNKYDVALREFCNKSDSGRNVVILATRRVALVRPQSRKAQGPQGVGGR